MEKVAFVERSNADKLFRVAQWLAIATIVYNILEGLVSVYFGFEDESLALFGFGIDSFIEVLSGIGIAHMVFRIKRQPEGSRNKFERTALRITGTAFYLLVAGLLVTSGYNFLTQHQPETTQVGIIISLLSIAVMWALIYGKTRVGTRLESKAILADAACTRVCVYMSVVLLISSGVFELTGFPYIDSIGALFLAYFSFKEGRECFEKARGKSHCEC
ncbi:MAG: cation transporter [Cyclobacteriaceae bacterium]|nr:cation transporter [Cyclobacteriaceae bacterium]